jgi:hypothetical protein
MCGPPTRKYTSDSVVGFDGSFFFGLELPFFLPTWSSTGDSTGPASIVTPATITPGRRRRQRDRPADRGERRVAEPSTTVSARLTRCVARRRRRPA